MSTPAEVQAQIDDWAMAASQAERERVMKELQSKVPWHDMHDGRGRSVPFSTRPHLISRQNLANVQDVTDCFLTVLNKTEEVAFSDKGGLVWKQLYEMVGPEGRSHLDQPYFERPESIRQRFRRADGLVNADTGILQFLEMNQVGPQAMTLYDSVHRLSADLLEVMGITVQRPPSVCDGILDWLILEYQQHSSAIELPHCIGIAVEPTNPGIMAAIPVAAQRMQRTVDQRYGKGIIEIVVCHQANFEFENGAMYIVDFDGRRQCDIVWRNAAPLDQYPDFCRPNIEGWQEMVRHPEALVVNNEVGPRLTRTKGTLALLWSDKLVGEIGLTLEERQFIHRHIPETHYLPRTSPDRLVEIADTKDDWVLKPSDDGQGRGILFGANLTRDALMDFMRNQADNYVAQRYVPTTPIHLQHITPDGRIVRISVSADLCPIIVAGKVNNLFSRGSIVGSNTGERQMHNVSQGGIVVPVFAV